MALLFNVNPITNIKFDSALVAMSDPVKTPISRRLDPVLTLSDPV